MSCPSVSLCVITRQDGSVVTSTNPTGGAEAWRIVQLGPRAEPGSAFCSAAPRCFISDIGSTGTVFTSTNPAGGAGAWTASHSIPSFESGACPAINLCVTVDEQEIATTTDPNQAAWTQQSVSDRLFSVSCPSVSLCVAGGTPAGTGNGTRGALDISTDPASGSWTHVDTDSPLLSISCPSTSLCVVTDGRGDALVSTNPTGGASAWVPTLLETGPCAGVVPCSVEHIETSDKNGLGTFDDSEFSGTGPFLTGLEAERRHAVVELRGQALARFS